MNCKMIKIKNHTNKPLGPSPPPTSIATSATMKANKSKDTGPEILLRKALREIGLSGYRLNWKKAPGSPDICFPGKKIAVFVNGCFWHRCPHCDLPLPKSHKTFWKRKFEKNKKRDIEKRKNLEISGWTVFEFWECKLKERPNYYTSLVLKKYNKR